MFARQLYLSLYVAKVDANTAFGAQRLGPAVSGLGALLLLARDLPAGPFTVRFATIGALVWFGVAATGVYHSATGVATVSIVLAALIQATLGFLFVLAARQMRQV